MSFHSGSKILVVFYSRSGATRTLAHDIARRCNADVEELHDVRSRSGLWGYLRSGREAIRATSPEIAALTKDVRDYETLVIGTPVWASHMSSPLRTYLNQVLRQSTLPKRLAFFCTMGGNGADAVFAELSTLTKRSPIATLALSTREVTQHRYAQQLESFARDVVPPEAPVASTSTEQFQPVGARI